MFEYLCYGGCKTYYRVDYLRLKLCFVGLTTVRTIYDSVTTVPLLYAVRPVFQEAGCLAEDGRRDHLSNGKPGVFLPYLLCSCPMSVALSGGL